MKKKVFVGLSGGVDSSVSAALLKEAGYDVTGVFIKVWQPDFISCNSKEDRIDAMRVAAHLGIPFRTLTLEKEYKKEVVDYMLGEYKKGNTPNPDVMCNKQIKFGAFLEYALKEGAGFVATGHYAQNIFNKKTGLYELCKSKDSEKDQTYFLWTLIQKELKKILFPVGSLKKSEVRILAKKFGLITADKKDSQGLCFMGKIDMKKFLKHYIKEKKGIVVDNMGNILGTHEGVMFYTLGERHGFALNKKTPHNKPYYVVDKNIKENELIVSHRAKYPGKNSTEKRIICSKYSFTSFPPKTGDKLEARVRYRETLFPCRVIDIQKNKLKISVLNSGHSATSGQSIVFYKGTECVGGGVII
ncbi:MAG: tRNA 2-thiouridine(34) synthase MnmA [Candidatus Lloydbacteria bacterium RIFCSPHIGHO2_01_FULL_41_20]|uniref:tRNA-specific 2-thiouridylase MnmA n=1 Tax=Candidatus Lloydbacteria bacterium RIFCSPHIGHO2_01_FULL_41_20 TaxID=1798657 RepID=A0A1G2CTP3_9BACT|nr:MAG: tRNA 2-thiouridine(34) synthase MnmA [Candidatus Lloydbacteria bacterium RIFCSPHIGHO2_01_FULL_41_20]